MLPYVLKTKVEWTYKVYSASHVKNNLPTIKYV